MILQHQAWPCSPFLLSFIPSGKERNKGKRKEKRVKMSKRSE